jgi:hypothetical protein
MDVDVSRLRQLIRQAEQSRQDHVQAILQERGPLRRGSIVKVHRKCGKPTCRCAAGEGHPATYLSCKHDGTTRMVYVPAAAQRTVTQEAQRYRRVRQHRACLAKLAQQSVGLVDRLQEALVSAEPMMPPLSTDSSRSRVRLRHGR